MKNAKLTDQMVKFLEELDAALQLPIKNKSYHPWFKTSHSKFLHMDFSGSSLKNEVHTMLDFLEKHIDVNFTGNQETSAAFDNLYGILLNLDRRQLIYAKHPSHEERSQCRPIHQRRNIARA